MNDRKMLYKCEAPSTGGGLGEAQKIRLPDESGSPFFPTKTNYKKNLLLMFISFPFYTYPSHWCHSISAQPYDRRLPQ